MLVIHSTAKEHYNALTHLLVTHCHTHTELAEVLEQ